MVSRKKREVAEEEEEGKGREGEGEGGEKYRKIGESRFRLFRNGSNVRTRGVLGCSFFQTGSSFTDLTWSSTGQMHFSFNKSTYMHPENVFCPFSSCTTLFLKCSSLVGAAGRLHTYYKKKTFRTSSARQTCIGVSRTKTVPMITHYILCLSCKEQKRGNIPR